MKAFGAGYQFAGGCNSKGHTELEMVRGRAMDTRGARLWRVLDRADGTVGFRREEGDEGQLSRRRQSGTESARGQKKKQRALSSLRAFNARPETHQSSPHGPAGLPVLLHTEHRRCERWSTHSREQWNWRVLPHGATRQAHRVMVRNREANFRIDFEAAVRLHGMAWKRL